MSADVSAYAALGLEPGADHAAVDRAYKALIKEFHPDRAGGDAKRAAEINRAYRELRELRGFKDALLFQDDLLEPPAKRWRTRALALAVVVLVLGLARGSSGWFALPDGTRAAVGVSARTAPGDGAAAAMDEPLFTDAIDEAIRQAVRVARAGDEMALAKVSRDCHQQMRREPRLAQLDRCAAFDDAVIQLQDRDPLRDRGPFSELAVTGRQMSSATLLSNDYLAMDSRLDRVRLRVELALAAINAPPDDAPGNEP